MMMWDQTAASSSSSSSSQSAAGFISAVTACKYLPPQPDVESLVSLLLLQRKLPEASTESQRAAELHRLLVPPLSSQRRKLTSPAECLMTSWTELMNSIYITICCRFLHLLISSEGQRLMAAGLFTSSCTRVRSHTLAWKT